MSKSEFTDWKQHPVTKQVFLQFQVREQELKDRLAVEAGTDPLSDRYFVGYLAAVRDLYLVDYEGDE